MHPHQLRDVVILTAGLSHSRFCEPGSMYVSTYNARIFLPPSGEDICDDIDQIAIHSTLPCVWDAL
jgi:hypothetical protein